MAPRHPLLQRPSPARRRIYAQILIGPQRRVRSIAPRSPLLAIAVAPLLLVLMVLVLLLGLLVLALVVVAAGAAGILLSWAMLLRAAVRRLGASR